MKNQQYNKYASFAYQMENQRLINRNIIARQYLLFISILYGHTIEDGSKRVQDYYDMTMLNINEELAVRTQVLQRKADYKVNKHFEEAKAKEIAMFEQLKRLQ